MRLLKALSIIYTTLYMVGCGYVTANYGATPENVNAIKAAGEGRVSVNKFSSVSGKEHTSIGCRAAGPIKNQNDQTFESYIHNAFINELKMADAYDESSEVSIRGEITELDFNSNIGAGKWKLSATISSSSNKGYKVESIYPFSTNWVADKACQQVAQAFQPAVSDLINKIVTHPEFSSLVKGDHSN
ncbi:hypothetical protein [Microbulbifer sp. THAF38]|uniref:hypothetical protein n=1 Tax=Microbulbifer sp. THAF38 TaxID=2587856 RepID=UPI00126805C9|nr:hypothetical protein [Microbulbifer sp. THAF38]QFT53330.1 hypothetical protein FIU95_01875 [Microbulbifer sp. THAF38]